MAVIHRTIDVAASPESTWTKIADLGGVHAMMSFLTDARVDGDRRVCGLAMGGELSEIVLSVNDDLRRVAYAIVDSPFGLDFHSASMAVTGSGETAQLVWTTDLKPDAAADQVAGLIDSELANIAGFLSGNA